MTSRSVMKSLLVLCLVFTPLRSDDATTAPEPAEAARVSYDGVQLLKVTAPSEEKKEALKMLQDMEGKYVSFCTREHLGPHCCRNGGPTVGTKVTIILLDV
jgi:hypothetical protein